VGLSAIRATTAGVRGFSLLAVLVYVADEHPAAHAGMVAVAALVEATWRVRLNEGQGE
jgi:HD superfamily phosphohydrolase YqeK